MIRLLGSAAAENWNNPEKYQQVIATVNSQLGKFERGYFSAWRDACAVMAKLP